MMFKEYEKFELTEDEYHECRCNMESGSYHVYKDAWECSVLYFDGDDGVALITGDPEVFSYDGFKIELIDCRYCDIRKLDMVEIIHILEEFEEIDDEWSRTNFTNYKNISKR